MTPDVNDTAKYNVCIMLKTQPAVVHAAAWFTHSQHLTLLFRLHLIKHFTRFMLNKKKQQTLVSHAQYVTGQSIIWAKNCCCLIIN